MPLPGKYNGVSISPAAVKRIFATSRYVEQQPRSKAPEITGPTDFGGAMMFHVTTSLSPMSGATPGASGRGRIQKFDGTSFSDFSVTAYKILNPTNQTVLSGAYVLCVPAYGHWFYVQVDKCSSLM